MAAAIPYGNIGNELLSTVNAVPSTATPIATIDSMVKYAVVDVSVCNLTSVDIPVTIMVIPVGGTLSENKYVIEWETTVAPGKPLIRSRLALSPGASIYVFPVVAGTVVNDVIAVSVNGIPKL